jgi:Fic family protein
MFTPKYNLTSELLGNLSQIARLYGQLEGLRLPKKLELNLERKNLIQSAYVSNSIEGNPLSLPEVTNLLLGERMPVNRNEKEVTNYFALLKDLPTMTAGNLDLDLVLAVHKRLLQGVDEKIAGSIRNSRVVVGKYVETKGELGLRIKHEPPYHTSQEIQQNLSELLSYTSTAPELPTPLTAGIFHHQFVYIHPFVDGNGRTCRLLTALLFLKGGYLINKYFVLDDYYDIDRLLYSDKLHSADSGDQTEWLSYFTEGVKYSLQSALAKAKSSVELITASQKLSDREQQVLTLSQQQAELTSNYVAQQFKVSRQQAHSLLNALAEKGFLEKKGSTKSSYYVLK